jgi:hypothetical protein
VRLDLPGESATSAPNKVESAVRGVGGWGGLCTCPDGQSYRVGDNTDSCRTLACIGGTAGSCSSNNPGGGGVRVTCGGVRWWDQSGYSHHGDLANRDAGLCKNDCPDAGGSYGRYQGAWIHDNDCDDGGPGTEYSLCKCLQRESNPLSPGLARLAC